MISLMSLDCWGDDYSFYVAYWRVDHSVLLLPPFPGSEDDRWDANLKILDVFSIYSLQVSSFICLYHNGALPISFTHIFQNRNQIHEYSTRYSDVYRPHTCRTNIKKFSVLFQGPRILNSLPKNIKDAHMFKVFKRLTKPFLRVKQDSAEIFDYLHTYIFFFSTHNYILKIQVFTSFIFKSRLVFKLPNKLVGF